MGGVIGGLALLGILFFFIWRRYRRRSTDSNYDAADAVFARAAIDEYDTPNGNNRASHGIKYSDNGNMSEVASQAALGYAARPQSSQFDAAPVQQGYVYGHNVPASVDRNSTYAGSTGGSMYSAVPFVPLAVNGHGTSSSVQERANSNVNVPSRDTYTSIPTSPTSARDTMGPSESELSYMNGTDSTPPTTVPTSNASVAGPSRPLPVPAAMNTGNSTINPSEKSNQPGFFCRG